MLHEGFYWYLPTTLNLQLMQLYDTALPINMDEHVKVARPLFFCRLLHLSTSGAIFPSNDI